MVLADAELDGDLPGDAARVVAGQQGLVFAFRLGERRIVGDPLVKLKFRPNPRYQPPSRVEQVLTAMQGFVLVDVARYRLASIDGTLFRDVNFGWGILGHLDRGGHFLVQQQEIGDNRWEISHMALDFTGKILLVKNLAIGSTEVFSDFKKVPPGPDLRPSAGTSEERRNGSGGESDH